MSSNWKSLGAGLGVVTILVCAIASAQDRKANAPAAVESVDLFNSVEVRSTVLTSRPDGARVEKGDVVCELDPADLKDRLACQDIVVQGASADVQGARLEREVAVIALTEYKEGLYAQDVASVEGKIKLAEAGLSRSEDQVDWVRRMFQKGYASMGEKVTEELTLKQARFGLEQAQMNRKVLVDYTKNKMIKALLGAVETARARARQAGGARAGTVGPQAAGRPDPALQDRGPGRRARPVRRADRNRGGRPRRPGALPDRIGGHARASGKMSPGQARRASDQTRFGP